MAQNLRRLIQQAAASRNARNPKDLDDGPDNEPEKIPHSITLQVNALAAGTEGTDTVQLDPGEIFIAESATYAVAGATLASITEAAKLYPLVLIQLRDTASGKGVYNERTPLASTAGDARQPFHFPVPIVFLSKPYLEAENISTDITYSRVFVTLHGYKLKA